MRKHLVIPDTQVTPHTPTDHLRWIGLYIAEKKPDVIVHLGDHADMESLSSYDLGKRQYEGRRYKTDIDAAIKAMAIMCKPMQEYNAMRQRNSKKQYHPEMHFLIGNHENRINVAVDSDSKMEGFMQIEDLKYADFGWQVHPFLSVARIDGVHYSHYFYNPLSGRPYGGQSIDTRLKSLGFSFVQGHQQSYMVGSRPLNNGKRIRGLVHGSAYLHDEDYRGPQANGEERMIFMLHEVKNGDYMLMEVSLSYLCRRYEGIPLHEYMQANYPKVYEASSWLKNQAGE
jgi:hypothetical protein